MALLFIGTRQSRRRFSIAAGWACVLILLSGLAWGQSAALAAKSERAKQAMVAGTFEEAVTLYTQLVRAMPGNAGLHMNLGLALHSAGQYREAVRQFRIVVKQQPNSGPAWLMLGLAHLKVGEPAKAVGPLERTLKAEPRNKIARLELADTCLSLDRPEQAAVHFQKLTELDPNYAKSWQGLGLSYVALSHRAFTALETIAPESAYWCVLLARSLDSQDKSPSAFQLYRQALAKAPGLRGVHAALAGIYQKSGHPDWAAVEEARERQLPAPDCASETLECHFLAGRYSQLVAAAKGNRTPVSYYWQARAYSQLSLAAFTRLSQMPPAAEIHELMAEAYRIQGYHRRSAEEWQQALRLAPQDRRLEKGLARALWLDRDYRKAQPLLEELVRLEPESAELNYELGDTLLRVESAEKAIPYLAKAVKSSPGLLPAHASLATAYLRLGRAEQAIPHLRAALDIDESGSSYYQLARAYEKIGQEALAKQTLQKFEEISKSARARRQRFFEDRQITPP